MPSPRRLNPEAAARRGVPGLRPYIPGRPLEEVREEFHLDQVVKLASNECPLDPTEALLPVLTQELGNLRRYPDGNAKRLTRAVAARMGVPQECLVFGNGAEECIRLVAQAFLNPEDEAIQPQPIFDAYETATLLAGARPVMVPLAGFAIDLEAMLARVDQRTKLVWICSPANPTGGVLTRRELDRFLDRLPDNVLVVLDEAYREFVESPDAARAEDYLFQDDRVVGLRTFSKAYGMAGLRVGYLVAHPEVCALVAKVKLPFNVNVLAQAAALHMLEHPDFALRHLAMIKDERRRMVAELTARGLAVVPSQTNFLLVELPLEADRAFRLLMARGYIIRPGSIWGLARHIRLSMGTPEQNDGFLRALDEVIGLEA